MILIFDASDGELTHIPTPLIPSLHVGRGRPKVGMGTLTMNDPTMDTRFEISQDGEKFVTYIEGRSKKK